MPPQFVVDAFKNPHNHAKRPEQPDTKGSLIALELEKMQKVHRHILKLTEQPEYGPRVYRADLSELMMIRPENYPPNVKLLMAMSMNSRNQIYSKLLSAQGSSGPVGSTLTYGGAQQNLPFNPSQRSRSRPRSRTPSQTRR